LDQFADCVQFHVDLCRAVIAEVQGEAKQTKAPQWFKDICRRLHDDGEHFGRTECGQPRRNRKLEGWCTIAIDVWPAIESELTRRVEQATAAKDKRIAELEAELSKTQMVCIDRGNDLLTARNELMLRNAECERLKESCGTWERAANYWRKAHDDRYKLMQKQEAESATLRQQLAEAIGANDAWQRRCAKLESQLAEATKPVEDVDWEKIATANYGCGCATCAASVRKAEPLIQRERAARLAAERERDELREFVKTWNVVMNEERINRHKIDDARLNQALAAYRASQPAEAKGGAV
jgi:hypothetical protein